MYPTKSYNIITLTNTNINISCKKVNKICLNYACFFILLVVGILQNKSLTILNDCIAKNMTDNATSKNNIIFFLQIYVKYLKQTQKISTLKTKWLNKLPRRSWHGPMLVFVCYLCNGRELKNGVHQFSVHVV